MDIERQPMQNIYVLTKADWDCVMKINNVIIQTLTNNDIDKVDLSYLKKVHIICVDNWERLEHRKH